MLNNISIKVACWVTTVCLGQYACYASDFGGIIETGGIERKIYLRLIALEICKDVNESYIVANAPESVT